MKTAVIVDNHETFRQSLKAPPNDFNIVFETNDYNTAFGKIKSIKPNLLILDYFLIEKATIPIIKEIKSCQNDIIILVVSFSDNIHDAHDTIIAGANGYFLKYEESKPFRTAVSSVLNNIRYISPAIYEELETNYLQPEASEHKADAFNV